MKTSSFRFRRMQLSRTGRILSLLAPLLLAISLSGVYLATLAPGLTWAHDGADGGDLIAAAATGGVAHPGGYPLYLLLARLFQALPLGTLAYRTNLMSAACAVGAALLVFAIVLRHIQPQNSAMALLPALAAGYAAGLSPLLWSQAVITEVYALQAFLVMLVLYLSTGEWPLSWKPRLDRLRGALLGLAMGNHLTTLLLAPAAILLNAFHASGSGWRLDWRSLGRQLGFFLAGCLVYLVIPLRALSQSPVNWGDAVTPGRFWWLVSGSLYQDQLLGLSAAELVARLRAWSALLMGQFHVSLMILGIAGLVLLFRLTRLPLLTLWIVLAFSGFAILYSSPDSYVYLLPVFLAFSIWIGLGLWAFMSWAGGRSSPAAWGIGAAALLVCLFSGLSHWQAVDASGDVRAEAFGREVMASTPANALVFAEGDRAVFSLWYFHYALRQRPDLVVIASDLLAYDWYRQTLASTYPSLRLPDVPLWPDTVKAANPALSACSVEYRQSASVHCD